MGETIFEMIFEEFDNSFNCCVYETEVIEFSVDHDQRAVL
jgi:hypothetical protein